MPNKTLIFKNYFFIGNETAKIESVQQWSARQLLHGKASRARTRFLRLINDRVTEIAEETKKIAEDHCEKNKTGRLIFLDKDGKDTTEQKKGVNYKVIKAEKFDEAMSEYRNEEYKIDITSSNSETIYGVRDIILNTQEEFSGNQAVLYDEISQALEDIKEK